MPQLSEFYPRAGLLVGAALRITDVWWLCGSDACAQQVVDMTGWIALHPSAPQGLNIGGGGGSTQEIKIRLRHHEDATHFLEWHNVMGTMLHGRRSTPRSTITAFDT